MKVAVINFSGNVGKTTIARHLLAPRITGAEVISIESINADDGQAATSGTYLILIQAGGFTDVKKVNLIR